MVHTGNVICGVEIVTDASAPVHVMRCHDELVDYFCDVLQYVSAFWFWLTVERIYGNAAYGSGFD